MEITLRPTFIIIFLLCITSLTGISATTTKDFNKSYKLYQKAVKENDVNAALEHAETALILSKNLYGDEHQTTAVLTYNYAKAFYSVDASKFLSDQDAKQVFKHYDSALRAYEAAFGKDELELIDPLLDLATIHFKQHDYTETGFVYADRALTISEKHPQAPDLLDADLAAEIGRALTNNFQNKRATEYLRRAYIKYKDNHPENSKPLIYNTFWLAKNLYDLNEFEEAETLFVHVFNLLEKNKLETSQLAQTAASVLVRMYERQKQRKSADRFSQAIGKANPWKENTSPRALYLSKPKWPRLAHKLKKDGYIRVYFTVDKYGYVKDPYILEDYGYKGFKKTAIDHILLSRFTPKYHEGEFHENTVTYDLQFTTGDTVKGKPVRNFY